MIAPFVTPDPGAPCFFDRVASLIGELLLTGSDEALTGLYMLGAPGGRPPGMPPARSVSPAPSARLRRSCTSTSRASGVTSTCRCRRTARRSSWRCGRP